MRNSFCADEIEGRTSGSPAGRGLKAEFESELESLTPALMGFARKLSGGRTEAEDLVQETVVKALTGRSGFDGRNMRAWLFTILKNHFFNESRKSSIRRRKSGRMMASSSGVWMAQSFAPPDSRWTGQDAVAALDNLSPEFRDVVVAVEVEGLHYREASEKIGCPVGTVMSRLHRARAALSEALNSPA